jgi:hypothetical protein
MVMEMVLSNQGSMMLLCPLVVEYSALVTESNIPGNARLFLTYSLRKALESLSLTFGFMLACSFSSGTDCLPWRSRVCQGQMVKVVGKVKVGDSGSTVYLVSLFFLKTGGKNRRINEYAGHRGKLSRF